MSSIEARPAKTAEKKLIPYVDRIPEPLDALEEADEYTSFAEANFPESDKAFAEELSLLIPHGATAIDIGSGPAIQAIELAKLRPDLAKIYALDLDPGMLLNAQRKAMSARLEAKFAFRIADMTRLGDLELPTNSYVFSNTAIHELRTMEQLAETFSGIASLVGKNGGCMIRDLLRPEEGKEQAKSWREEVLKGAKLPKRRFQLFKNSQLAGFSLDEVRTAIDQTPLKGRGNLEHLEAPKSRYWAYEIKPAA